MNITEVSTAALIGPIEGDLKDMPPIRSTVYADCYSNTTSENSCNLEEPSNLSDTNRTNTSNGLGLQDDQFNELLDTIASLEELEPTEEQKRQMDERQFSDMPIACDSPDDVEDIIDKDELYIDKPTIRILIEYPLEKSVVFECKAKNGQNFTRGDFAEAVRTIYKRVYDEENSTTNIEPGFIPNMLNRNTTNGKYGIWGHVIEDLILELVYYSAAADLYILSMGS